MNDQSDIDVVVELAKPDLFYLIGIKQDLEEYFHRSIDIVRYRDQMNIFLKNRINAEAIYV
jgi:predicted nucleotidyltransferase